jgi:hypothetical protein
MLVEFGTEPANASDIQHGLLESCPEGGDWVAHKDGILVVIPGLMFDVFAPIYPIVDDIVGDGKESIYNRP